MPFPWRLTRAGVARAGGWVPARRGRLLIALFLVTCAVIAGSPTAPGKAQPGSNPHSSAAQVRIFRNGTFVGGGTLVHREWVLSALHLFYEPASTAAALRDLVMMRVG